MKITLLHAYKEYKKALEEGVSEEEAKSRQTHIEEEFLHKQMKIEEQRRLEEKRKELVRKIQENQRVLDAQLARLNRLTFMNSKDKR